MYSSPRWRLRRCCALVAVLLSACGLTVPADQAAQGQVAGRGVTGAVEMSGPTGSAGRTIGGGASVTDRTALAPQAGAAPGPGASSRATGGVAPSAEEGPTSGRGFTADTVYIGVNSWQDVGEVSGLLGGGAINTGDQQAYAEAVIDAINEVGGIAGRRLEPVFYDFHTNQAANTAVATQEACTLWTQDHPVFAVVYGSGMGLHDDDMAACLTDAGVPMVLMNYMGMSSWFSTFPLVWAPMSALNARFLPQAVRRANEQGYFGGWDTAVGAPGAAPVKVGIQTGTGVHAPETAKVLQEAVEAAGHQVVAVVQVDGAADGAGAQSAVLRFRADGVTHVLQDSQCVGGTVPFMSTADSQDYHPRYFMHTGNCPQLLTRFTPKDQWRGAIGAGIQPGLDVAWAQDPGDPSPARPRCLETMENAGEDPRLSRDAYAFMVWYCDGFAFLLDALRGGGDVLTAAAFLQGAQGIRSMEPSATFEVSFPQRRDGAAALRDLVFQDECQCPVYVGGNRPF